MSPADPFAAVKRRHPDIPQDPLPLDVEVVVDNSERTAKSRKAVGRAVCPLCSGAREVPLDREGGRLVLRTHYRPTAKGSPVLCRASGTTYDEGKA